MFDILSMASVSEAIGTQRKHELAGSMAICWGVEAHELSLSTSTTSNRIKVHQMYDIKSHQIEADHHGGIWEVVCS